MHRSQQKNGTQKEKIENEKQKIININTASFLIVNTNYFWDGKPGIVAFHIFLFRC